jgi:hypothetical protein
MDFLGRYFWVAENAAYHRLKFTAQLLESYDRGPNRNEDEGRQGDAYPWQHPEEAQRCRTETSKHVVGWHCQYCRISSEQKGFGRHEPTDAHSHKMIFVARPSVVVLPAASDPQLPPTD